MQLKVILFTGLGFVFLALGFIGLFLPIWPTTPFVLVAAACFSVNPKIQSQIMKIKFFREHYENYQNRVGLPRKNVIVSLSWLWGTLILSMILIKSYWALLLILVGIAVTWHILHMANPHKESKEQDPNL